MSCAPKAIQTARQTNQLQSTPRMSMYETGSDDFIAASESAAAPHCSEMSPLEYMSAAKKSAPAKFAQ